MMINSCYRSFFDYIYAYYSRSEYLNSDPLIYYYNSSNHSEYCAFTASVFSYGRVSSIKHFLSNYFKLYGESPYGSVSNTHLYYRFQSAEDIVCYRYYMSHIYHQFGSIENYLTHLSKDLEKAIQYFYKEAHAFGNKLKAGKGYYFLFPNPSKSSAKRLRMFLRWMIRKDSIDPGVWEHYESKQLVYPLDTHIIKFAFHQKIISSPSNSFKNTMALTEYFRKIDIEDPVKYDFSLTRLGMLVNCQYVKSESCFECPHSKICPL